MPTTSAEMEEPQHLPFGSACRYRVATRAGGGKKLCCDANAQSARDRVLWVSGGVWQARIISWANCVWSSVLVVGLAAPRGIFGEPIFYIWPTSAAVRE